MDGKNSLRGGFLLYPSETEADSAQEGSWRCRLAGRLSPGQEEQEWRQGTGAEMCCPCVSAENRTYDGSAIFSTLAKESKSQEQILMGYVLTSLAEEEK